MVVVCVSRSQYRPAISVVQFDSLSVFVMLESELHNYRGDSEGKTEMHSDVTGVSGHRRRHAAYQVSVVFVTLSRASEAGVCRGFDTPCGGDIDMYIPPRKT